jgi:hypothetical protein
MALPKIETPKYRLTVPSTQEEVDFRPYLVKEEKILMMAMESQDQRQMMAAIKDIIASCTFEKVNVEKLTTFDLEYIFVQMRAKSVGEIAKIGLSCDNCKTKNEVDVNLEEIEVRGKDQVEDKIELTNDVGLKMKYPDVNTVMDNLGEGAEEIDRIFALMIACIDYIYQGDQIFDAAEQSKKELTDFVESLSSEQFGRIQKFFEAMPQTASTIEFDCDNCGTHNKIEVKGLVNFFT